MGNITNMLLINLIKANLNNRKLLVWGAWFESDKVVGLLRDNGISIYGYIDRNKSGTTYNSLNIFSKEIIEKNKNEYYVCVCVIYHKEVFNYLSSCGYTEILDFYWFFNNIAILKAVHYRDFYGNEIIGTVNNFIVNLRGFSKLIIGNNCTIDESVRISLSSFSTIIIGDNCNINSHVTLNCEANSTITIGSDCIIGEGNNISSRRNSKIIIGNKSQLNNKYLIAGNQATLTIGAKCCIGKHTGISSVNNSIINIGKNTLIERNCQLNAFVKSVIDIGDDCMISYYVKIRSDDGHGIFDIKNRKDISFNYEYKVKVGNHVCIGMCSIILYNSIIGNGSIVGANTVVKRQFPNNCIIVGVPAKIIRKDVAWSRNNSINYDDFYELDCEKHNSCSITEDLR